MYSECGTGSIILLLLWDARISANISQNDIPILITNLAMFVYLVATCILLLLLQFNQPVQQSISLHFLY